MSDSPVLVDRYIYIYIYKKICVYIHVYIYMSTNMNIYICIYIYIYIHACICIYVYIYITSIYIYIYRLKNSMCDFFISKYKGLFTQWLRGAKTRAEKFFDEGICIRVCVSVFIYMYI
jgi:hypothetical protein